MTPPSVIPDTIVAIATPVGRAAVGIIRLSGAETPRIAAEILGATPPPRIACLRRFLDADGATLDAGLALYFPAPASFTGEPVLEMQGHGGALILDLLLQRVLALGARMARPGEFTERAFLNGKMDLAQACSYDRDTALANIRRVAPKARIFETSAKTAQGMDAWREYLLQQRQARKALDPLRL